METGAFRVSPDPTPPDQPEDIRFEIDPDWTSSIPKTQQVLKSDIEKTIVVFSTIYPKDSEKFSFYFKRLIGLAQYGLVGSKAQPDEARETLVRLQQEFAEREGEHIKNKYLSEINIATALSIFIILIFSILTLNEKSHALINFILNTKIDQNYILNYIISILFCIIGVWVSSFLRIRDLEFFNLNKITYDQIHHCYVIFFTIIITIIFSLFVISGSIKINIAEFDISNFYESLSQSAIFGFFSGFSERIISKTLKNRLEQPFAEK